MRIEKGRYIAQVDIEATRAAYDKRPQIQCECAGCRNYLRVVDNAPAELAEFLQSLGVDIHKPVEMTQYNVTSGEMAQYGGFFHLVGEYEGGAYPDIKPSDDDFTFHVGESTLFFSREVSMVEDEFPRPVLQLEVFVWLPWVLEEAIGE